MTTQAPIARFTRLRHATFASPDPERLLDYYRAVIGLGLVGRDGNRIFLASDSEQLSLVIEPGDAALTSIAFEISPDVQIEALGAALKQADLRPELQSDPLPGVSSSLSFSDPEGTRFELIQGWTPTPAQERIGALAVTKLGHVALRTPDPLATSKFLRKRHGFAGLRLGRGPLRLHAQWLRASHAEFRAWSRAAACIISHSNCATPPTCSRRAIISARHKIRYPLGPGPSRPRTQHRRLSPQPRWAPGRAVLRSRSHDR